MTNYKHFEIQNDDDRIVWLGINRASEAVNSINTELLDELNSILQDIAQQTDAKGLIIYSAKEKGFIAGADVKSFSQMKEASEALEFLRKGQVVFARLEALPIPSVAMIDGFCMGGGLELALACRYRIASDEADTRLGLPEVLLGIHPGWGGTVRLPRLIGGFAALSKVMLTGAALSASRCKNMGMVDDVVPLRQLRRAAVYYIKHQPARQQAGFWAALSNRSGIRSLLAPLMRYKVAQKVNKKHYPAPYALLDLWEKEGASGERAYHKEVDSVQQLVTQNETARNLIRAFLLRERLKSFAKDSDFKARHVHVIGAGVMGGDIAAWCALKGLTVTLQDQSAERIAPAIGRAHQLYEKKLRKPRLVQAAMDRLIVDPQGHGIPRADVIIEAVFENLEVKQDIFQRLEKEAKKTAILATNTSSIPLDDISVVMKDAKRLVGIHFFNPVSRMELIEVVRSEKTLPKVSADACSFVGQIARLPLPVQSSPGFLINRVLMPYLMECVQLLEEGVQAEQIDMAAKEFGMFMGPVELADTVGMDVCLAVAQNLTQHYGGLVPQKLRDMVEKGELGRKSGKGFYEYKKGKPIKKKVQKASNNDEITQRLIMRIVNESAACLREAVVADADLLDAGMIFATGFAPFRGGPMHYAESLGQEQLHSVLTTLSSKFGERFSSDAHVPMESTTD
ncbi:MAG: enoyl-CoA hydratase/isomerase family protein [Legionellaceae bacterium]|nr:enoyl-CoA hydratase/isomerase family protein [Legionellaceae bacterium]